MIINIEKLTPYQALFCYCIEINLPVTIKDDKFYIIDIFTNDARPGDTYLKEHHFISIHDNLKNKGWKFKYVLEKGEYHAAIGSTKIICNSSSDTFIRAFFINKGYTEFEIPNELIPNVKLN